MISLVIVLAVSAAILWLLHFVSMRLFRDEEFSVGKAFLFVLIGSAIGAIAVGAVGSAADAPRGVVTACMIVVFLSAGPFMTLGVARRARMERAESAQGSN